MATTTTDLLSALVASKPHIYGEGAVGNWRNAWNLVLHSLPTMNRLGETYIYHHIGTGSIMSGTEADLAAEFPRFEAEGFVRTEGKTYHALLPHPKVKKMCLRAEITPVCFAHDEKELPLCPLMFGIGEMWDSMTYLRVSFSVVKVPKDQVKVAFDLANGKF